MMRRGNEIRGWRETKWELRATVCTAHCGLQKLNVLFPASILSAPYDAVGCLMMICSFSLSFPSFLLFHPLEMVMRQVIIRCRDKKNEIIGTHIHNTHTLIQSYTLHTTDTTQLKNDEKRGKYVIWKENFFCQLMHSVCRFVFPIYMFVHVYVCVCFCRSMMRHMERS